MKEYNKNLLLDFKIYATYFNDVGKRLAILIS